MCVSVHTQKERVRTQMWQNVSNWKIWVKGLRVIFLVSVKLLKFKKILGKGHFP